MASSAIREEITPSPWTVESSGGSDLLCGGGAGVGVEFFQLNANPQEYSFSRDDDYQQQDHPNQHKHQHMYQWGPSADSEEELVPALSQKGFRRSCTTCDSPALSDKNDSGSGGSGDTNPNQPNPAPNNSPNDSARRGGRSPSSPLNTLWAKAEGFFSAAQPSVQKRAEAFDTIASILGNSCVAPCNPRDYCSVHTSSNMQQNGQRSSAGQRLFAGGEEGEAILGIARMQAPQHDGSGASASSSKKISNSSSAALQEGYKRTHSSTSTSDEMNHHPNSTRPQGSSSSPQPPHTPTSTVSAIVPPHPDAVSPPPQDRSTSSDAPSASAGSAAERRRQRHKDRLQRHQQRMELQQQQDPNGKADEQQKQHRTHEEIEVSPGHHVQVRLPPTNAAASPKKKKKKSSNHSASTISKTMPLETLEVKPDEAAELERSISELTMRSSYAATENAQLSKLPDNRRMAYYAVGKHHRQSGRGGNRRCYFTGKLILGGAPFYAGSVQQGLRTLVVFCLPSALGLPEKAGGRMGSGATASSTRTGTLHSVTHGGSGVLRESSRSSSKDLPPLHLDTAKGLLGRSTKRLHSKGTSSAGGSVASKSYASKSMSRLSSLDDLSLSIEGDLDPNYGLDRDFLLAVLPPASPKLLEQMATLYPEQFETLPVQVREPERWRLYVKFCFFSGLPIAEGEMHYKVRDEIAEQTYGEEIVLSHDVMEASTGSSSAEILTLPNRTVLRYLRKHYSQQCSKLDDVIFQRASWERVAPEV